VANPYRDFRHGLYDRDRRTCSAGDIVAIGPRRPEQSHDAVADVLVDRSAEALDQGVDGRQKLTHDDLRLFRAELRCKSGETHKVDEHDRNLAPLGLAKLRGFTCQGCSAATAKHRHWLVGEAAVQAASDQLRAARTAESPVHSIVGTAHRAHHGTYRKLLSDCQQLSLLRMVLAR